MAYAIWLIAFFLCLARTGNAFDRLVPDPGIDFIVEAYSHNLLNIFSNFDGYINLAPRLIGEVLSHIPLEYGAILSSVLTAVVWACSSLIVWSATSEISGSRLTAFICAISVPLIFAASESSINNVWNIKWILLPTAAVVLAAPIFQRERKFVTTSLLLLTGLSHAYIIILTVAFLCYLVIKRKPSKHSLKVGFLLIAMSVLQFIAFATSSTAFQKYGQNTYTPWPNSGVFWHSVWLVPVALSLTSVVGQLMLTRRPWVDQSELSLITFQALAITMISYFQFGIKDSPSVATVGLSTIGVILLFNLTRKRHRTVSSIAIGLALICAGTLSAKFFPSSSWLSSGPRWSSTVRSAHETCKQQSDDTVEIQSVMYSVEVSCARLP